MRIPFFALICAILASPLAYGDETPTIRTLSAEQITDLMDGDTFRDLEPGSPLRAEVIGLIEAPLAELAPILVDYPNIPQWAPATRDIEVVGSEGECTFIEGTTALPWPISDRNWRMCSRSAYDTIDGQEAFVYRFNYVHGTGNIDESFGFWVLYTLPEHPEWTYVRYVVNADAGVALPGAIIRWVTRSALPDLIDGLRDRHDDLN